jgi:hypothetical protein
MSNSIDENLNPPPSGSVVDHDYLTQDIEVALRIAVQAKIESIALARGVGRRKAAMIVLAELQREEWR